MRIKLPRDNRIKISMTSKCDPYENAKAERINGTIKNEFELDGVLPNEAYAQREIAKQWRYITTSGHTLVVKWQHRQWLIQVQIRTL